MPERVTPEGSARESAELPTEVKEVLTLLVNSKMPGKPVLHMTFDV
jgi:hypothetical protein